MHWHQALMAGLGFLVVQTNGVDADPVVSTDAPAAADLPAASHVRVVAHGIDFVPDTSIIRPDALPVLNEAAQILDGDGPIVVRVDQPTDGTRHAAYQNVLTRRRAKAVRRILMDHGVTPGRITLPPDAGAPSPDGARSAYSPVELRVE